MQTTPPLDAASEINNFEAELNFLPLFSHSPKHNASSRPEKL